MNPLAALRTHLAARRARRNRCRHPECTAVAGGDGINCPPHRWDWVGALIRETAADKDWAGTQTGTRNPNEENH